MTRTSGTKSQRSGPTGLISSIAGSVGAGLDARFDPRFARALGAVAT